MYSKKTIKSKILEEKEIKTCFICGRQMSLKHQSNYSDNRTDSFSYASRKTPDYMHFDLFECKSCKVLSAQNMYEVKELNRQYREADFDSLSEAQFASKTYIKYLVKMLPHFVPEKILDIGTGEGSFLNYARQQWNNVSVVGVEPSVAPVAVADPTIKDKIINEPFESSLFEESEFDMVSCFQTVEHIPDSINLLNGIHRILKRNGYAYFVCHDYCSLVNRILGQRSPIYDIEHLQIYSEKSIKLLFEKADFKNIKLFRIKNRYPFSYWMKLLPIPNKMKDIINKLPFTEELMLSINVGNIGVIAQK